MKKSKQFVLEAFLLFFVLTFASCQKKLDKYYEVPGWLKGNAYQLLESEGNYSMFLQAVERAGYKDVISGKGIITVMAPSDDAMQAYLQEKGFASIDDIPLDELKKLVGFHLVYYAFDKDKFANYRPEGITEQTEFPDAGLYYKFRTKSSSGIESYVDPTVAPDVVDNTKLVYHKERFLPVFSSYLFDSKQIDAASNYQYFYPNSTWDGQDGGFCVSNSNVDQYAMVTDNGYVYELNKVLEPLETIHKELDNSTDYTLFEKLYDKFSDFQLDEGLTQDYGNGKDLYLFYHTDLPKIASEWSYNGEGNLPDYADLAQLSRLTNNLFAPSNEALTNFFNEFWADYYPAITDVNFLPIKYLLDNHVYEGDIVFPQEIQEGKIETKYGNPIQFDTNDVSVRKICSNGTFYGLNNLTVPKMFTSVTAPLFQNPDYRIFLFMMDKANMVQPLMSEDIDMKLFMPTNKVLEDNTTINGRMMLFQNTNPNKYGAQSMMIEGADQPWINMNIGTMAGIVKNHMATKLITTVDNKKVYKTLNPFQYLLVEDDDKVYSSFIFNNYPDDPMPFKLNSKRYNGESFDLTGGDQKALVQDYSLFKEQISKNPPPDMEYFKEMVGTAQFNTTIPPFNFMQGERFIAFVPTNQAILDNFSQIPLQPAEMAKYLKYYFVSVNESGFADYPFPGAGIQGELTTFKTTANGKSKLTLIDAGDKLQVKDAKGNIVNVVGVFPRIYNDGAAYAIDGLLEDE